VAIPIHIATVDIADTHAVEQMMDAYNPQIIFHLAARRRVEIVAQKPEEGVRSNVIGTWNLLQSIRRHPSVERFVFASSTLVSDPKGIYDKTKRVGELLTRILLRGTPVRFSVARFVNVWESSPVLEDFTSRVQAGKTVHVQTPNATRYFMR